MKDIDWDKTLYIQVYKKGSDLLNWLMVRNIVNKMKRGDSPVILIDGNPNAGKTVLGALICQEINFHFHNKDIWDPKKYAFWDIGRLAEEIDSIVKRPILIPEAGFDLAFDRWMSPANRFFDIILQTQRVLGNCYILNVPVNMDLAKRQRRKSHYRVFVKKHGFCIWYDLQKKSRKKYTKPEDGVRMGTFENYSHKDLICFEELRKLDEDNKERIREESKIIFKQKISKGKTYYNHKCETCGYTWTSWVEKPKKCANLDCRKRLVFVD